MTVPLAPPSRHPAWRVLTEPASPRTWRELAYLLLSYLVGGIGLAYVLTAAYVGALLVITVVGLPLVGLAVLEKHVAGIVTKLDLPPSGDDHRRVLAVLAYLGT